MNRAPKHIMNVATLLVTGAIGTGLAFALHTKPTQARSTAPASADSPQVEMALDQTRQLVRALGANDWRPSRATERLLRLPVQDAAEYAPDRDPSKGSFSVPRPVYPYEDVAVFSKAYVRQNIRRTEKDGAVANPSGFYLAGYRDGRVETVPVARVKTVKVGKLSALVFPGSKAERESLP